jgi:hypothetical protein
MSNTFLASAVVFGFFDGSFAALLAPADVRHLRRHDGHELDVHPQR